jgi:putative transposase
MAAWAEKHNVELEGIQSGKPTQNSYIKWFNCMHCEEVLDLCIFNWLREVHDVSEILIEEYNGLQPYESLGNMTLEIFAIHAGQLLGMDEPENCRGLTQP